MDCAKNIQMTAHCCKMLTRRSTRAVIDGAHCHVWWLRLPVHPVTVCYCHLVSEAARLYLSFLFQTSDCVYSTPTVKHPRFLQEAQTSWKSIFAGVYYEKSRARAAPELLFVRFWCQSAQSEDVSRQDKDLLHKEWIQGSFGTLPALLRSSLQVLQWNSCLRTIETANWSH